jgi:hypothetical protein
MFCQKSQNSLRSNSCDFRKHALYKEDPSAMLFWRQGSLFEGINLRRLPITKQPIRNYLSA